MQRPVKLADKTPALQDDFDRNESLLKLALWLTRVYIRSQLVITPLIYKRRAPEQLAMSQND